MAHLDAALHEDVLLDLREHEAVGPEEALGEDAAQALEILEGAHALVLQGVVDLGRVLVHVGLKEGAALVGVVGGLADELLGAAHERAQGVGHADAAIRGAVPALVEVIRCRHGLVAGHGYRGGEPRLVHRGDGERGAKTRSLVDGGGLVHEVAAGVHERGGAGLDHLERGELGGEAHELGRERGLEGQHDARPDHGELVEDAALEELLARVGVAVHETGHDEPAAPVDARGGLERGVCLGVGGAQQGDAARLDADGLVARDARRVGEKDGRVRNQNIKHGCLRYDKGTVPLSCYVDEGGGDPAAPWR